MCAGRDQVYACQLKSRVFQRKFFYPPSLTLFPLNPISLCLSMHVRHKKKMPDHFTIHIIIGKQVLFLASVVVNSLVYQLTFLYFDQKLQFALHLYRFLLIDVTLLICNELYKSKLVISFCLRINIIQVIMIYEYILYIK